VRLTFRAPDRTLTDEEAQTATERIVEALRTAHGAERR
jgi:phenylalanyl-tRNA synthetase beta subunit